MAKKSSTVENRVYLFRDLAAAWLQQNGGLLASKDSAIRKRALRALSDLAFASCAVSDSGGEDAASVADQIRSRS